MNGFSEKTMNNPHKVEQIELVLEELDRMGVVSTFKNLKMLTLINVNIYQIEVLPFAFPSLLENNIITTIQGLEELIHLESMWLDENHLTKIEGLQNNINLK